MQQGIGIQLKADPVRNAICSCREEQGSARAKRTRAPVGSKEVGDLPDLIGVESPEIKNLGECRSRGQGVRAPGRRPRQVLEVRCFCRHEWGSRREGYRQR